MGVYTAHLVGESNYQAAVGRLRVGDPIQLVPEPDNKHDPDAIAARDVTGATVGYIERGHWITRAMTKDRAQVKAAVKHIMGREPGQRWLGVVLEVRTGGDLDTPSARSGSGQVQRVKVETSPLAWIGLAGLILIAAVVLFA